VTILATPVFGGHYGVDVLAGLVMAVLSLSAAPWMARRRIGWRGNLPTTASHVG
jgi:membrane-associated phospholipid phosphatase